MRTMTSSTRSGVLLAIAISRARAGLPNTLISPSICSCRASCAWRVRHVQVKSLDTSRPPAPAARRARIVRHHSPNVLAPSWYSQHPVSLSIILAAGCPSSGSASRRRRGWGLMLNTPAPVDLRERGRCPPCPARDLRDVRWRSTSCPTAARRDGDRRVSTASGPPPLFECCAAQALPLRRLPQRIHAGARVDEFVRRLSGRDLVASRLRQVEAGAAHLEVDRAHAHPAVAGEDVAGARRLAQEAVRRDMQLVFRARRVAEPRLPSGNARRLQSAREGSRAPSRERRGDDGRVGLDPRLYAAATRTS